MSGHKVKKKPKKKKKASRPNTPYADERGINNSDFGHEAETIKLFVDAPDSHEANDPNDESMLTKVNTPKVKKWKTNKQHEEVEEKNKSENIVKTTHTKKKHTNETNKSSNAKCRSHGECVLMPQRSGSQTQYRRTESEYSLCFILS